MKKINENRREKVGSKRKRILFFELIFNVSLFIGMLSFSLPSYAQLTVFDPASFSVLMANLPAELSALKAQISYLKEFNWNTEDASTELQNLTNYLQQSGNLATSANAVAMEFQQYYPGYQAPENFQAQYQVITNDTRSALESAMQVMASINSASDPMHQNENLQKIQMQIAGAQGTLQATQGLAQITAQLATNLEVLQKTIAAQASAQDAYMVGKLQAEASDAAGLQKMFSKGRVTAPKMGESGEFIELINR